MYGFSNWFMFFLQTSRVGLQCIPNLCELVAKRHFNVILLFIYSFIWPGMVVSMPKAFFMRAVLRHVGGALALNQPSSMRWLTSIPKPVSRCGCAWAPTKCCSCLALRHSRF